MIQFKQVICRLGDQQFCFNVQIPVGQVVAIMGSSGAGKSTLLNLLAGFIQPQSDSAQILLNGQRVDQLEPSQILLAVIAGAPPKLKAAVCVPAPE